MAKPVPSTQTCEGCIRTREEVAYMLTLQKGGMPTYICTDCIDTLKELADLARTIIPAGKPNGEAHAMKE